MQKPDRRKKDRMKIQIAALNGNKKNRLVSERFLKSVCQLASVPAAHINHNVLNQSYNGR